MHNRSRESLGWSHSSYQAWRVAILGKGELILRREECWLYFDILQANEKIMHHYHRQTFIIFMHHIINKIMHRILLSVFPFVHPGAYEVYEIQVLRTIKMEESKPTSRRTSCFNSSKTINACYKGSKTRRHVLGLGSSGYVLNILRYCSAKSMVQF